MLVISVMEDFIFELHPNINDGIDELLDAIGMVSSAFGMYS